jgi:hypothetical protein
MYSQVRIVVIRCVSIPMINLEASPLRMGGRVGTGFAGTIVVCEDFVSKGLPFQRLHWESTVAPRSSD